MHPFKDIYLQDQEMRVKTLPLKSQRKRFFYYQFFPFLYNDLKRPNTLKQKQKGRGKLKGCLVTYHQYDNKLNKV